MNAHIEHFYALSLEEKRDAIADIIAAEIDFLTAAEIDEPGEDLSHEIESLEKESESVAEADEAYLNQLLEQSYIYEGLRDL